MSMTAEEWMKSTYYRVRNHNAHDPEGHMIDIFNPVRPWAVCADGTIISLQGSSCHYSKPKVFASKYISVEVGLLDSDPILGRTYFCEETGFPPGDGVQYIYANVAMDDVERFVSEHGGIVNI